MVSDSGRGRDADDDLSAEPPVFSDPAFSEGGMRRIVYGRDSEGSGPRDSRSQAFEEDTEELAADLRGRRNIIPIVTALAAVVCFAAIVWYAYSWGTGQMESDELPVVRAEPVPEKVRPEQPGGMEVPHQGIAVLNNGRQGETPQTVERLLPRPEIPAPPEPLPEELAEAADPEPEQPLGLPEAPALPDGGEADVTEAPQLAPEFSEGEGQPAEAEQEIAKPLPKPEGRDAIAQLLEKESLETANGATAEPAEPAPAAQTTPKQTAEVATGAVVLQLSSVKSEAAAAQEWKRLQAAHPALLGKLALSLETAAVQGTTYYRVQTGPFASRAAAAQVCTQLKSQNQDCLVKQR